jgi:hypothetical protein
VRSRRRTLTRESAQHAPRRFAELTRECFAIGERNARRVRERVTT